MTWFWRRVWVWDGSSWRVAKDEAIRTWGVSCVIDGPSFCEAPPPFVFERWYRTIREALRA